MIDGDKVCLMFIQLFYDFLPYNTFEIFIMQESMKLNRAIVGIVHLIDLLSSPLQFVGWDSISE
jgi:hypothetical protein